MDAPFKMYSLLALGRGHTIVTSRELTSRELTGRGHTIVTTRELKWCYACSWDVRGDWTLNFMAQIHTSVTLYVAWSHVELWSAHAPARLTHFCCSTHFVRREQRVECSYRYLWMCLSCEGMRNALSSGYDHIALWLLGNSLCSFRHTSDSCLCLTGIEAGKLAQTGFEDTSLADTGVRKLDGKACR